MIALYVHPLNIKFIRSASYDKLYNKNSPTAAGNMGIYITFVEQMCIKLQR